MKKWTGVEIKEIIKLNKKGKSYNEISLILNRTPTSVRVKLNRLGYKQPKQIYYEDKKCIECGKKYIALKSDNRLFCSHSCSSKYNNKNRKKVKNINTCIICNKKIGYKSNFCGNTCYAKYNKLKIYEKIESNIFILENKETESSWIKKYLIEKYGNKCMVCNWDEKHPITNKVPIQLNHIDGNSENNNLDNVELLCPNCHSLTFNFGSLNKGNGRLKRKEYRINYKKENGFYV